MSNYESLLSQASLLPPDERWQLIDALYLTLHADDPPQLSEEWLQEIDRRNREIDDGTAVLIPWEEVKRDLWKKLGLPNEA